jgi:hypothetical protein
LTKLSQTIGRVYGELSTLSDNKEVKVREKTREKDYKKESDKITILNKVSS